MNANIRRLLIIFQYHFVYIYFIINTYILIFFIRCILMFYPNEK